MRNLPKVLISLFLAFLLSLAMVLPVSAADPMQVSVVVPQTRIEVGDPFLVEVAVVGNTGFSSVCLTLSFNQHLLSCETVSGGALTEDMLLVGNPAGSQGARIAAVSALPVAGDGIVAEFMFIAEDSGDCVFSLTDCVFYDENDNEVSITKAGASVVIAENPGAFHEKDEKDKEDKKENNSSPTGDVPEVAADSAGASDPSVHLFIAPDVPTFADVPKTHWGYFFVERAAAEGLLSGTGNGCFSPDTMLTRGQFATVLWKMNGEPVRTHDFRLSDVPDNTWYSEAAYWAVEQKYMDIMPGNMFDPEAPIARQDMISSFFRCAGLASPGQTEPREATDLADAGGAPADAPAASADVLTDFADASADPADVLTDFADAGGATDATYHNIAISAAVSETVPDAYEDKYMDWDLIAEDAKDAMYWALTNKIISGTSAVTLRPDKAATRAQAAVLFLKYADYLRSLQQPQPAAE